MTRLLLPVGLIVLASLVELSSISVHLFYLQLAWVGLGTGLIILFYVVDWRTFLDERWFITGFYIFTVLLLGLTYLVAPVIRNTRSWLVLGPLNFQPVEFAKIALILVYASYFSRRHLAIARWQNILTSFGLFLLPAGLTLLQPDLGSTLVLFGIWFGFLLASGLPWRRIAVAAVILAVVALVGWHSFLKPYQKERILGVIHPETNAQGINYSVIQSKIAIGSAGLFGKGYKQGSQTQLGFLPEAENDFILAAFVEEWGLFAGLAVVGLMILVIFRVLQVGFQTDRNFNKFFSLGTAITYGIEFMLNAGSTVGILPVVGITFPFFSYGGSNLLTSFFLLAIINAIARRSA